MGRVLWREFGPGISTRSTEFLGLRIFSTRTSEIIRVDDQDGGPGASFSAVDVPLAGPVCYERQRSPSSVFSPHHYPSAYHLDAISLDWLGPRTSVCRFLPGNGWLSS